MSNRNIEWVQWETRTGEVKAFAVDKNAELKNGILRAVNGSAVPAGATEASSKTPKDEFCVKILMNRDSKPARAPRAAKEPKAPKAPVAKLKVGKATTKVLFGGAQVGEFDTAKLDRADGVETEVRVTDKTWAVYQNKQRVTSGKLAAEVVHA